MNVKIIILLISILLLLFSGCVENNELPGTYYYNQSDNVYFTLHEDLTFQERFKEGYTATGEYTYKDGILTLTYKPFGSFITLTKTDAGFKNKSGGIYAKK
jgi:hypothetical protein